MTDAQPDYQFTETQDWFSFNIDTWKSLSKHITSSSPRVLEIGSWEGRSAVFLLTELIDSGYAMPAAVAIRSTAKHTLGRVTFYVIGRGLSEDTKTKIQQSIIDQTNQTIVFIDLPSSLASSDSLPDGMTWGKIAMVSLLPVERVLYLDADVLIRGDLKELWDTDLEGKPIAAAADVGLPAGHDSEGVNGIVYFNAGVLLMNLAVIRGRLKELYADAARIKTSTHQDQDALNVHFKENWRPLSLKWNAQGLGTYARYRMPERDALPLEEMEDPGVVHFTGALHPSVAEVLNPFVQPYGAKPWGYAGAPGHPYADEWWQVCEETAWKGWQTSKEYREQRAQKMEEALALCTDAFRRKIREGQRDH